MDTKTKVTIKVKPKSKQKCNKCKHILKYPEDFVSPITGRIIKMCTTCVLAGRCIHDRKKTTCRECKGGGICKHDRVRSICKDCGGGEICEHNKRKSVCKDCKGGSICGHHRLRWECKECSDTFTVIAKRWIRAHKLNDKKKNRDHDLNLEFCVELLNTIQNCVYCDTPFTYQGKHDDTYVTLQRLDNELGHTRDNCTLCCKTCNQLDGCMYKHSKKS